jgi:hypothetical protein
MRHRGAPMADPDTTKHEYRFFKFGCGGKWHILQGWQDDGHELKPVCTFARGIDDCSAVTPHTRTPGGPICRQCLWGRERGHWDRAEDDARRTSRD